MQFADLLTRVSYLPPADVEFLSRAYEAAASAHHDQNRLSGEKFIEHPLSVAAILADLQLDRDTLAAAILHDTVEDTHLTVQDLEHSFGGTVGKLVAGVTKLDRISFRSQEQAQAENVRKMLVAMAEDVRVVLMKLADRLHNMRTVNFLPEARRRAMAQETLDIYAPLAHRLGMWNIKWELEDLSFAQLHPDEYADIVKHIARKRREREAYVKDIMDILERELAAVGIAAETSGRPKHVYSIANKMALGKEFDEIYDLSAIRVLTDSIKDCYGALGVIHALWKPIPGRFKDYIAMPKSNGYQSLHTTVVSQTGEPMEIQIRTHEMHRTAEWGVAAHWAYKEGGKDNRKMDQRFAWLRQLMEWQKEVLDAETFVDAVKVDVFRDEVFVFTPRGDVLALPSGATAVDFAYRIHTEVGHRCIGAKANSRMVPLDYPLQNGDILEILTSKGPHGPSRDWLAFVKTAGAAQKIRGWFKKERREENVAKGKELLDKEFRRMQQRTLASLGDERVLALAAEFHFQDLNDFFAAVGYGDVSPHAVLLKYIAATEPAEPAAGEFPLIPLVPQFKPTGELRVKGERGVLTQIARCCKPVPGDPITGYITRGKGISVHRTTCKNVLNVLNQERRVDVEWDTGGRQLYPVAIKIEAWDRTGLLRDIATVIAENKINLTGAEVQVYDDKTAVISTTVEISSLTQLSRLMERLETVKDVHTVAREGNLAAS
ncbi:MAG TPA: bifunctional (p)ppGpp synthetase/guanosine-3',5'-bis(diphosphate) 3'-pyrophosphohydrolase [Candidatus Limnocylindrales bacterium]|nr:bifunctional (p)ppGpp synthetase/guanosine-3',5'-bis(diphosphate) 3'-pyrophosphohydrolase [Candidatus Limnocylindrales bacterium]